MSGKALAAGSSGVPGTRDAAEVCRRGVRSVTIFYKQFESFALMHRARMRRLSVILSSAGTLRRSRSDAIGDLAGALGRSRSGVP